MTLPEKTYLGDGVYAVFDRWGSIVLTTSDGLSDTNTIVLEPEVYAALLAYVDRTMEQLKAKAVSQGPF